MSLAHPIPPFGQPIGPLVPRQDVRFEAEVFSVATQEELQAAVQYIRNNVEEAKKTNPDLKPLASVTLLPSESQTAATQIAASSESDEADFSGRTSAPTRILFSLLRGVSVGSVVYLTLSIKYPEAPVASMMGVGWVLGELQGSFYQYFNNKLQDYMTQNHYFRDALVRKGWVKPQSFGARVATAVEEGGRWFSLDFIYVGVLEIALIQFGLKDPAGTLETLTELAILAGKGTVAGAGFDLAFASKRNLLNVISPKMKNLHQKMADLKLIVLSMAISGLQAAGAIDLIHNPNLWFYGMGAAGALYYAYREFWVKPKVLAQNCSEQLRSE